MQKGANTGVLSDDLSAQRPYGAMAQQPDWSTLVQSLHRYLPTTALVRDKSLQSCWPFATLWPVAHQAPLSVIPWT